MSNEDKVKKQCLLGRTPDEHMRCHPAACRGCGWNQPVEAKRKKRILDGNMQERSGVWTLVV